MQLQASAEFRGLLKWYKDNSSYQIKPWRKGGDPEADYIFGSGIQKGEIRVLNFLEGKDLER